MFPAEGAAEFAHHSLVGMRPADPSTRHGLPPIRQLRPCSDRLPPCGKRLDLNRGVFGWIDQNLADPLAYTHAQDAGKEDRVVMSAAS